MKTTTTTTFFDAYDTEDLGTCRECYLEVHKPGAADFVQPGSFHGGEDGDAACQRCGMFCGIAKGERVGLGSDRENCVAVLYTLSHRSLRFKGLAKEARVVEVLKEIEETGTERDREKARKVLHMMRTVGDDDGEEGSEFGTNLDSNGFTPNRYRVGGPRNNNLVNSTAF